MGQSAHLLFLDPVPKLSEAVWIELQGIYLLWLGPILVSTPLAISGTNDPHLHKAAQHNLMLFALINLSPQISALRGPHHSVHDLLVDSITCQRLQQPKLHTGLSTCQHQLAACIKAYGCIGASKTPHTMHCDPLRQSQGHACNAGSPI